MNRRILSAFAAALLVGGGALAEESRSRESKADTSTPQRSIAVDAMRQAHLARATWMNFPGFSAQVSISTDGNTHEGEILVTPDFEYELSISDDAIQPWVHSKLRSVLGHRRPGELNDDVSLVNDQSESGFGLFLRRDDGGGTLRIQDGLIREVHRKSDSRWFEITNVELFNAGDGKVLPEVTSVTYRDPATGNITKNKSNRFTWTKVGRFQLPERCFTVETGQGGARQTRELYFVNHVLNNTSEKPKKKTLVSSSKLQKSLPESLTSFGAAVVDEYLYVFSGHSGEAHGFGKDLLVDHFRRIKIDDKDAEWEELAMHESAQSTALVSDGEYIYRIGGLSFLEGESKDRPLFNSTDHFARYDIKADKWTELAPLPSPRSSLDAAIVDRTIYVVGGWDLQGERASRDAPWMETMHAFDLDNPEAGWQELEGPGYKTRALSCAAHKGKLYILGGISSTGFLRKTSVFDPATKTWSEGPELVSDSRMTGFATSSFAVGGHLYSTGASGIVYRLSDDGNAWEVADRLMFPRMFLRLLPVGADRLIALGGTGGFTGRTAVVETLKVDPEATIAPKSVSWTVPYTGETKHSQALVMDGTKLYAFGGNKSWEPHDFSQDAFSAEAFVFDIANQTVARLSDMPFPVQSGAGAVNRQTSEHKTMVVAGGMNFGETRFSAIDDVLEYDSESDQWSVAEVKLPQPRAMAAAVAHDDALWIFGGSDAGGGSGLCESVLHWWGDATDIAPLPEVNNPHARRSFGGAMVDDEYFMIGGLGFGMSIESKVDVFNVQDRTWRTAASPKHARVFPMVAVDGKKIYLFGGFSNNGGHFNECSVLEVYDSESDSWSVVSESIDGVDASMRLFNMGGRLLFFGIDREVEEQAKFVLYDPTPTAAPEAVQAMSFGGRGRGGSEATRNAKMLMRRDRNKDGKLSLDELGKRMATFIDTADTDGDRLISFAEAEAKMKADEKAEELAEVKEALKKKAEEDAKPKAAAGETASKPSDESKTETGSDRGPMSPVEAQREADRLQRIADAAQREADRAQREADRIRRED